MLFVASFLLTGCVGSSGTPPTLAPLESVSITLSDEGSDESLGNWSRSKHVSILGPEVGSESPHPEPDQVIVASARQPGKIIARQLPNGNAEEIAEFQNPTAIGAPLVFQAVSDGLSADQEWIEVLLPMRPNGSTGWISVAEVELRSNPYRVEVRPDQFELSVFKNNELVLTAEVGIGTGDTPTPVGRFYIIELLETPNPEGPYGPYAFGLSGFSETLQTFAGGNGVIGIHGTNEASALGTNVSHGCIRVDNTVVTEMSTFLPLGTPVIIGA